MIDQLKEFAKALIERSKSSGAIDASIVYEGCCETCSYEYAKVEIDEAQLDRDIDALCAEFEQKNKDKE